MAEDPHGDVTQLLNHFRHGDGAALAALVPLVEKELRRLAGGFLRRERPNHTLQPTALVNEAYIRLADQRHTDWKNRAQFFGIAASLMRRILVDYARKRGYAKRGGGAHQVTLDDAVLAAPARGGELIALDEALERLAAHDARMHRVVELRYFGGASVEETAEVLSVSPITVKRDWQVAKAWLHREMTRTVADP
jgi:RNA polymerase sigma factor (TIGR02999 family)